MAVGQGNNTQFELAISYLNPSSTDNISEYITADDMSRAFGHMRAQWLDDLTAYEIAGVIGNASDISTVSAGFYIVGNKVAASALLALGSSWLGDSNILVGDIVEKDSAGRWNAASRRSSIGSVTQGPRGNGWLSGEGSPETQVLPSAIEGDFYRDVKTGTVWKYIKNGGVLEWVEDGVLTVQEISRVGPTGSTGATGAVGPQGPPGVDGVGIVGPPGPVGPRGGGIVIQGYVASEQDLPSVGNEGDAWVVGGNTVKYWGWIAPNIYEWIDLPNAMVGAQGPPGPTGPRYQGRFIYKSIVSTANVENVVDHNFGSRWVFVNAYKSSLSVDCVVRIIDDNSVGITFSVDGSLDVTIANGDVSHVVAGPTGPTGHIGPAGPTGLQGQLTPAANTLILVENDTKLKTTAEAFIAKELVSENEISGKSLVVDSGDIEATNGVVKSTQGSQDNDVVTNIGLRGRIFSKKITVPGMTVTAGQYWASDVPLPSGLTSSNCAVFTQVFYAGASSVGLNSGGSTSPGITMSPIPHYFPNSNPGNVRVGVYFDKNHTFTTSYLYLDVLFVKY